MITPVSAGSLASTASGSPNSTPRLRTSSRRSSVTVPPAVDSPRSLRSSSTFTSFRWAIVFAVIQSCWMRGRPSTNSTASVAGSRSAAAIAPESGFRSGGSLDSSCYVDVDVVVELRRRGRRRARCGSRGRRSARDGRGHSSSSNSWRSTQVVRPSRGRSPTRARRAPRRRRAGGRRGTALRAAPGAGRPWRHAASGGSTVHRPIRMTRARAVWSRRRR